MPVRASSWWYVGQSAAFVALAPALAGAVLGGGGAAGCDGAAVSQAATDSSKSNTEQPVRHLRMAASVPRMIFPHRV
jgi:hypothetical protein